MSPPSTKALGLFLGRAVVLYGVLTFFVCGTALSHQMHRLLVATTAEVLPVLSGSHVAHTVFLHNTGGIHIKVDTADFHKDFDIGALYDNNLCLFLAIVLASAQLRWRQRFMGLAVGGGTIILLDTLIMLGTIWGFEAHYPQLRQALPSGPWRALAGAAAQLSPTGGAYMLPIFVWGFVLMSPLVPRGKPTEPVGRNASCPCGSGRKYKVCCAR